MKAFADAKMYGVVGWAQRANNSLFMTQSLVGPMADGSAGTIWKHEKFRPSGEERTLFSDGLLNTIRAQKLPFGVVSMLNCWEACCLLLYTSLTSSRVETDHCL